MNARILVATVLAALTCTAGMDGRTWTDTSGKHTIEAELVGFQDGQVHLKKPDGTVIKVPLKNLCPADQQFVQQTAASSGTSKTKTPEGGGVRINLLLGGTPFRVDSLEADGAARLSLDGLKPETQVGPGSPLTPEMLVSMVEGYYLGLLGLPDSGAASFPGMSSLGQELRRAQELQVLSAQVVEVHKGASVTIRVAPEAAQRLKPGTRLVLVRPGGTSTVEMRQLPGLLSVVVDLPQADRGDGAKPSFLQGVPYLEIPGGGSGVSGRIVLEPFGPQSPVTQAANEAERQTQSNNNLRQIAVAMHKSYDVDKRLPSRASLAPDGTPLLSWRVHLLPYLDQKPLYDRFHLNEPWDSPHNRPLADQMPACYRNPSSAAPPNRTSYLVPTGPGSIFDGQARTPVSKITDGTAFTLLLVEVNDDATVVWTKPHDLKYDVGNPLAGLGKAHRGGFYVALADGSVRFVAATIDPQVFLRLLMMADGKPVGDW